MPTFSPITQDVQWWVALASGTYYNTWQSALAAAVTLSAGNANAPVYIGTVEEQFTAPTATSLAKCDMPGIGGPGGITPGGGPILYAIQLVSGTTYYPKATVEAQAYTTSAANSNAPVYTIRPYETVTSP